MLPVRFTDYPPGFLPLSIYLFDAKTTGRISTKLAGGLDTGRVRTWLVLARIRTKEQIQEFNFQFLWYWAFLTFLNFFREIVHGFDEKKTDIFMGQISECVQFVALGLLGLGVVFV